MLCLRTPPVIVAAAGLLLTIAGTPVPSAAQCLTYPPADQLLGDMFRFFTEDSYAPLRSDGVTQLAPTEQHYVVSDSTVCQSVYAAAVGHLTTRGNSGIHLPSEDHMYAIYRIGPYYGIFFVNNEMDEGR